MNHWIFSALRLGRKAEISVTMASAASLLNSALSGTLRARCWVRIVTALETGSPAASIRTRTNLKVIISDLTDKSDDNPANRPESVRSDDRQCLAGALPDHQDTGHQGPQHGGHGPGLRTVERRAEFGEAQVGLDGQARHVARPLGSGQVELTELCLQLGEDHQVSHHGLQALLAPLEAAGVQHDVETVQDLGESPNHLL